MDKNQLRRLAGLPTLKESTLIRESYEQALKEQKRMPNSESLIMKDPQYAYLYALNILKARWKEAEEVIMKSPEWAVKYATTVLNKAGTGKKVRWQEAEPFIKKDPKWWEAYKKAFGIVNEEAINEGQTTKRLSVALQNIEHEIENFEILVKALNTDAQIETGKLLQHTRSVHVELEKIKSLLKDY